MDPPPYHGTQDRADWWEQRKRDGLMNTQFQSPRGHVIFDYIRLGSPYTSYPELGVVLFVGCHPKLDRQHEPSSSSKTQAVAGPQHEGQGRRVALARGD